VVDGGQGRAREKGIKRGYVLATEGMPTPRTGAVLGKEACNVVRRGRPVDELDQTLHLLVLLSLRVQELPDPTILLPYFSH
jgi:hypothetical protein